MNLLGINLSFAVKRWPEPQVWANIVRERLQLDLVQFTFDLLDPWWSPDVLSAMARRVRSAAAAEGIIIHSAFAGLAAYTYNQLLHPEKEGRAAAKEWYKRAIDLAAELGVDSVGGPLGGMSVMEKGREARYRELLDAVRELAEYARAKGLGSLLVEPTPLRREVPWTPEGARQLLADVGTTAVPIRYCVDIGHALYEPLYGVAAGLRPWLDALGDEVAMIHLQQTDGKSDSHWSFTGPRGIVDPTEVLGELRETGLGEIPVVLEVFHPFELADEAVLADLEAGVAELRRVFSAG